VPVRISTLLAGKGDSVATITADTTVTGAVDALREHGVGALVVSSDGKHIDGIVSERDIVRGLSGQLGALLAEPVRNIMTAKVFTVSPDDDVESLMAVMTERRIRHVPVVCDEILCGIISIGDVVKSRIDELEKDRKELVEYINAR
jgi:CBS domain-containing protein